MGYAYIATLTNRCCRFISNDLGFKSQAKMEVAKLVEF